MHSPVKELDKALGIINEVEPNQIIKDMGTNFKQDLETNVNEYAKYQSEALKIMLRSGWK